MLINNSQFFVNHCQIFFVISIPRIHQPVNSTIIIFKDFQLEMLSPENIRTILYKCGFVIRTQRKINMRVFFSIVKDRRRGREKCTA
jgi:hypothetical protein